MSKWIYSGLFVFSILISPQVHAQKPGGYVRKPMPAPNFFVPQKALPQPEKLPPFNIPEPEIPAAITTQNTPHNPEPDITFERQEQADLPETSQEEEFNPNLDITLPETSIDNKESSMPKYKQEYDAYVKDLNVIAETGQAPANPELEKDLEKLNSEDRLEVDEDGRILNSFQQSQLINPMANVQILEQVEIDRTKSTAVEEPYNPFANGKELSSREETMSPEVAAYFRGTNPFYDGEVVSYDDKEDEKEQNQTLESDPILETVPAPTQESPLPEAYTPPSPKKTHSSGGRSRSSRGSSQGGSVGSFNLGPNMVR